MTENNKTIELNVGGRVFTTRFSTLIDSFPDSRLARIVTVFKGGDENDEKTNSSACTTDTDSNGRLFIDRDPEIFSYVLQYLREVNDPAPGMDGSSERTPDGCKCRWLRHLSKLAYDRFQEECDYFQLPLSDVDYTGNCADFLGYSRGQANFNRCVSDNELYRGDGRNKSIRRSAAGAKFITLGYRATYEVSRDAFTNDKFRRITRITVCGNAAAAKEVFDDDINDSRDPDRQPSGGYTSRYYLKHNHLEKAFEALAAKGFCLLTSTSSGSKTLSAQSDEYKQWTAYLDYVFYRS